MSAKVKLNYGVATTYLPVAATEMNASLPFGASVNVEAGAIGISAGTETDVLGVKVENLELNVIAGGQTLEMEIRIYTKNVLEQN